VTARPGPTIGARVAVAVLAFSAAALALAAYLVDVGVGAALHRELDEQLASEVRVLASGSHWEDGEFEFEFDADTLHVFVEKRSGAYFEVEAEDAAPVRSASLDGAPFPRAYGAPPAADAPPESGGPAVVFATVPGPHEPAVRCATLTVVRSDERDTKLRRALPAPPRALTVRVARCFFDLHRDRARTRRSFAVAVPLGALLAAAGAFVAARRATRPIALLDASARRIATTGKGRLDAGSTEGELRALAETLNAAFDRVSAAAERERRFAADAAHELRTPLAVLRTVVELALSRPRDAEAYRAALVDAHGAVLRLVDVSESLLALHRAESSALRRVRLDLRDVVREAAAEFARRPGAAPPVLDFCDAPVFVDGDPTLLSALIGNLLRNAAVHAPLSAATLRVRVEDGRVVLRVDDDGPGFPADFLPRAFERLARGDAARSHDSEGGYGLGLAIVRAIAADHGGDAAAENRPEGGARVTVRLPRAETR
jgi:signal transduction histidine kinase